MARKNKSKKTEPPGHAGTGTTSRGATGADTGDGSHAHGQMPAPASGRGGALRKGGMQHPGQAPCGDGSRQSTVPYHGSERLSTEQVGTQPQGRSSELSIGSVGKGQKSPSQPQSRSSGPSIGFVGKGQKSPSQPQSLSLGPSIGSVGEGQKSPSQPQSCSSEPSIGSVGKGQKSPSQLQSCSSGPSIGSVREGQKSPSQPQSCSSEPSIGSVGKGQKSPSQPQSRSSEPSIEPVKENQKSSSPPQSYSAGPSTGYSGEGQKSFLQQVSTLTLSPSKSSSTVSKLPRRPDYGEAGTPIGLVANYFQMTLPSGRLYHYDVDIRPEDSDRKQPVKLKGSAKYRPLGTKVNRAILERLVKSRGGIFDGGIPAFDGRKNIYLRNKLRDDNYEVTVPLEGERGPRNFVVAIKFVGALSMDSVRQGYGGRPREEAMEAMQAVHCILKHGPTITYTPVGRSFFAREGFRSLGGGKEVWFGFTPTVHLCQGWKPMLNLNVTATTFYKKGPVVEFIGEVINNDRNYVVSLDGQPLHPKDISKVASAIKNMRVRATHLAYRPSLRVAGLTRTAASETVFADDGRSVSVADYFAQKYRPLACPYLPCIISGTKEKPKYYPVEVCEIPDNFHCGKKLTGQETAQLIRMTAVPPIERFKAVENKTQALIRDRNSIASSFGVAIAPKLVTLPGRVIEAPKIVLQGNSMVQPREGQWSLQGKKLFRPAVIDAWGVLVFPFRLKDQFLHVFLDKMQSVCWQLGMKLPVPKFVHRVGQRGTLDAALEKAATDLKGDTEKWQAFLLVMLDSNLYTIGRYEDIKLIGDCKLGLKTQCVAESNVFKVATKMQHQDAPQLVCNICLKINTKCGGVNNSFVNSSTGEGNVKIVRPKVLAEPVLILGADVNHPGVDKMHQPSFAALVGSIDSYPSRYYASVRVQKRTERTHEREIIKDLKDMVKETLRAFRRNTSLKPRKIVFYRDGVSEGQFYEVLSYELQAIRKACTELEEGYEPPITFVVVQKRHGTRLMPEDPRHGTGRHGNVPPGTTADTVITHPVDFDFYLCSHAGIQGTSRPSHYYVLHDDNDFKSDELQQLTYSLCHTYARCPRSVSIPAPAYYAHWVAFRAHQHATTALGDDDRRTVSSSSSFELSEADLQRYTDAVKVKEELKTSMYFM